jgi:hypothetical protein
MSHLHRHGHGTPLGCPLPQQAHIIGLALVGRILAGIGLLIEQELDEAIEARRDAGAEDRSEPVDPMVAGKGAHDDLRAEGASRVDAGTGEVDSCFRGVGLSSVRRTCGG